MIDVAEDRTVNVKLKKEENIPDDATVFNGHSYHIYSNFTWEEAEAYCESVGGHLVTITSQEEMNFITNELMNNTTNENCYWIGLQRDGDSWKWVTGEEFNYQNWAANEPNNYENKGENYVHLFGKEYTEGNGTKFVGTWNDVTNEGASYAADFYDLSNFGYICEWDTVNSNSNRNMYAQYFTIEPVVSNYGSSIIDEYGARLVVNDGAKIRKCAMYMEQVDGVWKRTMAFVGENITSAKYSPYVAYQGTILYDGYNNYYINLIDMYQSTDGIWSLNGNFRIVEADLEDNNRNHLTLRSTSVVGNNVQIFDDLDQMKEWLLS
ncbi:MAG: C-type lectin domain-containing protein [Clostridia bacterium]|nr:C-type lectin domain-containing protein [Clostridia bacterium]